MNFIVSLAHFCEIHGPTSIICTQVTPPTCTTCCPSAASSGTIVPSTPQQQQQQQFGSAPSQFSHNSSIHLNKSNPALNTLASQSASGLRPNTSLLSHGGTATSSASSSNVSTPMETPPPSPRSPVLSSASLATAGPGYTGPSAASTTGVSAGGDTCKNCSMTLPKGLQEKASSNGTVTRPTLRTKESILACTPSGSEDEEEPAESQFSNLRAVQRQNDDARHLSSSPGAHTYFHSAPASDDGAPQGSSTNGLATHTHQLTYISTRAPTVPAHYTTLRQACVRTLSCELIPAQTGPMMFGDPLAGYTIAYVFRLPDPKARGGRRSYALVCICPDQKIVVSSWKYVVSAFETLVHRIKQLAAKKQQEDAQVSPLLNNSFSSVASRGPEGFLRRRPPGENGFGVNQKGLAELVGREELFVEVHMFFVKMIGGLVRRFGCWAGSELALGGSGAGLGSGFVSPALARSRAGSVSSSVGADERLERKTGLGVSTPGTATPNAATLSVPTVSEEMEATDIGTLSNENGVKYPVPPAPPAGASLAKPSGVPTLVPGMAGLSVSDSVTPGASNSSPRGGKE
ncbi:uncharacterized protein LAJ45_04340 [Morchella importuna]|uniref:UDENN FLCN/SMCR8-type domain-containing protein n=1 Tax=Morchella conica CCBAS932 TaxID=1392247 RepID=A0A3N4KDR1_9PEZI|nr:uncharacterized protein LAJ45_04340 [Morchella importuna]KAH8151718.1 hypothetical protein LAJ45_04340 [Morchella importuna]RPB08620.1 hypothetical protein P167DRAFT_548844 [Morchella conica CCBAS932]